MEVMKIIGCSIKVKNRDKLAYLYTWKPLSQKKKKKLYMKSGETFIFIFIQDRNFILT